jgi:hypothetical protein
VVGPCWPIIPVLCLAKRPYVSPTTESVCRLACPSRSQSVTAPRLVLHSRCCRARSLCCGLYTYSQLPSQSVTEPVSHRASQLPSQSAAEPVSHRATTGSSFQLLLQSPFPSEPVHFAMVYYTYSQLPSQSATEPVSYRASQLPSHDRFFFPVVTAKPVPLDVV